MPLEGPPPSVVALNISNTLERSFAGLLSGLLGGRMGVGTARRVGERDRGGDGLGKAGEEGEVTRGVPAGDLERNAEPVRAWPGEGSPDAITGWTESGVGCGGSAGRFGEAAVARRPGGGRVEAVVVDSAAVVARGRPARGRFLRGGEFESSSASASASGAVASSTSVASQSRSRLGDGAAVRVRATSRDGEGLFGDLVTPRVEVRDFGGGERVEVAGAASLLSFAGLRFAPEGRGSC